MWSGTRKPRHWAVLGGTLLLAITACGEKEPTLGSQLGVPVGGLIARDDAGKLWVMPMKVRKGDAADLKGVKVSDESPGGVTPPAGTPYYVDIKFNNDSGEDLSGPPKMFGTDSEGGSLEQLYVTEPWPFTPCPENDDWADANFDGALSHGEAMTGCAVFVAPPGTALDKLHLVDASWDL